MPAHGHGGRQRRHVRRRHIHGRGRAHGGESDKTGQGLRARYRLARLPPGIADFRRLPGHCHRHPLSWLGQARRRDGLPAGPAAQLLRLLRGPGGDGGGGPLRGRAAGRSHRPHVAGDVQAAERVRRRHSGRRGTGRRRRPDLRRPVRRNLRVQAEVCQADAGKGGRQDGRYARPRRLRAHAPDQGAAHQAREGHVEHLHRRRADRADDHPVHVLPGQAGTPPRGRALLPQGPLRRVPGREDTRLLAAPYGRLLPGVRGRVPEARRRDQRGPVGTQDHRRARRERARAQRDARLLHRDEHEGRDRASLAAALAEVAKT